MLDVVYSQTKIQISLTLYYTPTVLLKMLHLIYAVEKTRRELKDYDLIYYYSNVFLFNNQV